MHLGFLAGLGAHLAAATSAGVEGQVVLGPQPVAALPVFEIDDVEQALSTGQRIDVAVCSWEVTRISTSPSLRTPMVSIALSELGRRRERVTG